MNINRVVITGNLTADPELRPRRAVRRSRGFAWRSIPAGEITRRDMGGEAQLLRRHSVGSPGRELRALPVQGTAGRGRRPA